MKKLHRSRDNKVVAGIIGGIGEYYDIDPTVLRVGFILLAMVTHLFPALIVYILAFFIIPQRTAHHD